MNTLEDFKMEQIRDSRLSLIKQIKALPEEQQDEYLNLLSREEFESLTKLIKRKIA